MVFKLSNKELIKNIHKFGTIADAARAMNIPRKTLSDRYHKALSQLTKSERDNLIITPEQQIGVDAQVYKMKGEKRNINKKYQAILDQLTIKDQQLKDALGLSESIKQINTKPIIVDGKNNVSQSTAVIVASDWHLEERVLPATVEHMNEYDLLIAENRAIRFFQNALKLIEMTRSKSHIDNIVLALLGDFIAGYIHPELMESNQLSPVQACIKAFEWICRGIDFFIEHGNFKRIIIPCCVGNHGRTTEKPRVSTEVANSYEWLLYQFIKNRYIGNSTVEIQIAEGHFCYLNIYNLILRFHHGQNIRYMGGVGGIHIPLNKAIAQWDKFKKADLDVLGHWHTRQSTQKYVINGSLIGFNPFAIKIKADFEKPCQTFFLLHPEKGKTVEALFWSKLESNNESRKGKWCRDDVSRKRERMPRY